MKNRRLVFITHARFWRLGVGFWTRARKLLSYLSGRYQVQVYFLGNLEPADREALARLSFPIRLTALPAAGADRRQKWREQFRQHEGGKALADAYFVDKIENSFIMPALPRSAVKILDMHDLVHARAAKEEHHRVQSRFALTLEQEKQIMSRFSAVLCIQYEEHGTVSSWIGEDRALLVPHPVEPRPQPLRPEVRNIGIVASGWHANVNGLRHFLDRVWPQLDDLNLTLLIYGFIAAHFESAAGPRIKPVGFQPEIEDCYCQLDIAINPVYYGAGLKIKSVEAMSFGVPLVTTPEGASGLEKYADHGLMVAKGDAEYAAQLRKLATSMELRKKISAGAIDVVSRDFSEEACFAPIGVFLDAKWADQSASPPA